MRVVYFKSSNATFVKIDERILSNHFDTVSYFIDTSTALKYLFSLFKLKMFLLFKGSKFDIYFIRFADWHTALIALFKIIYRKKLIVVIGGYDVSSIPQFNYGVHLRPVRSFCAKFAMKNATCLLPNSKQLIKNKNGFLEDLTVKGGILHFVRKPKGKIEVINNGYDIEFWTSGDSKPKENIVLTVVSKLDKKTFRMKGIDRFIEVAKAIPAFTFTLIGDNKDFLKGGNIELPDNFQICKNVTQEELRDFYKRSKVFCLFSLSEGMPNVLCEAMLCECIPVGNNVVSIPDIIGDSGFVIERDNIQEMIEKTRQACNLEAETGRRARKRIADNYSLKNREEQLVSIINGLED